MSFTGTTPEVIDKNSSKLIKRGFILKPQAIEVTDYIAMRIDYSEIKGFEKISQQLQGDFESVVFRALMVGKADQVRDAFRAYLKLYVCGR